MRSVFLATFIHCLALFFTVLYVWIWWSTYQDIMAEKLVIGTQTGLRYLMLPLVLPVLHIIGIFERKGRTSKKRQFVMRQGDILMVVVVALFLFGWFFEVQYFRFLEDSGYLPCEFRTSGIRSVFINYAKDTSLCPI